ELALGDELTPQVGDLGGGAEPAGDVHAEAALVAAHRGEEADVVDHHLRVVGGAAGEGHLELARQPAVVLVVEEVLGGRVRVGGDVEDLVLEHAGVGRGGDVAEGVGARPDGDDVGGGQHALRLDAVVELEVVEL